MGLINSVFLSSRSINGCIESVLTVVLDLKAPATSHCELFDTHDYIHIRYASMTRIYGGSSGNNQAKQMFKADDMQKLLPSLRVLLNTLPCYFLASVLCLSKKSFYLHQ